MSTNVEELPAPSGRLLLTVVEAAAVLAIGRTSMYGLINTGAVRVVHIGRSIRISVNEVKRYVDEIYQGRQPTREP